MHRAYSVRGGGQNAGSFIQKHVDLTEYRADTVLELAPLLHVCLPEDAHGQQK